MSAPRSLRAFACVLASRRAFSVVYLAAGRILSSPGAAEAADDSASETARPSASRRTVLLANNLFRAHRDGLAPPVLIASRGDVVPLHVGPSASLVAHREVDVLAGGEVRGVRPPDLPLFAGRAAPRHQQRATPEQDRQRSTQCRTS